MKNRQKQNKKKYDGYKHVVRRWQKEGFKTKEEYDAKIAWMNENMAKYGFFAILFADGE